MKKINFSFLNSFLLLTFVLFFGPSSQTCRYCESCGANYSVFGGKITHEGLYNPWVIYSANCVENEYKSFEIFSLCCMNTISYRNEIDTLYSTQKIQRDKYDELIQKVLGSQLTLEQKINKNNDSFTKELQK